MIGCAPGDILGRLLGMEEVGKEVALRDEKAQAMVVVVELRNEE